MVEPFSKPLWNNFIADEFRRQETALEPVMESEFSAEALARAIVDGSLTSNQCQFILKHVPYTEIGEFLSDDPAACGVVMATIESKEPL